MIIDSLSTKSVPPYTIVRYQDSVGVPASTDSTSLIELELPGLYTSESSYIVEPRINLTEKAYAIDLLQISISCESTDFSIKLLNRNDIACINTIYEVLSYTHIHSSMSDLFTRYVIRNRDIILDNKLYLQVSNLAAVDTGDINVELIYLNLQDRIF